MKVLDDPNIGAVFYLEDPDDFFIDDTPPPSSGSTSTGGLNAATGLTTLVGVAKAAVCSSISSPIDQSIYSAVK